MRARLVKQNTIDVPDSDSTRGRWVAGLTNCREDLRDQGQELVAGAVCLGDDRNRVPTQGGCHSPVSARQVPELSTWFLGWQLPWLDGPTHSTLFLRVREVIRQHRLDLFGCQCLLQLRE